MLHEFSIDYTVKESADPAFIDGRRGDIIMDGKKVGVFGEIHPAVLNAFELEHSCCRVSSSISEPYRDIPPSEILFYIPTVNSPKWKTLAARHASAFPLVKPS